MSDAIEAALPDVAATFEARIVGEPGKVTVLVGLAGGTMLIPFEGENLTALVRACCAALPAPLHAAGNA